MVINITKENYEAEVLKSDKPVLIDFWSTRCMPCMMLGPTLEEISKERPDIKVCKINVDEEYELATQYKIMSIPALFVMKNGEITNQIIGAHPKEVILDLL